MSGDPLGFDLEAVFARALKMSDPVQRWVFLDQACGCSKSPR
jgi:hypothetical protein